MINVTLILIANSYGITPIQDGDRVVKESHVMMCPEVLSLNPRNVDVKTPTIVTTEGIVACTHELSQLKEIE